MGTPADEPKVDWDVIDLAVAEVETALGLAKGFHKSLIFEHDDWSFIIKVSALIEAALTHVIREHFDDTGIVPFLADRTFSEKLRICKMAKLSDDTDVTFIRALIRLRNDAVHDVSQVQAFTFSHIADVTRTPNEHVREWLQPLGQDRDPMKSPDLIRQEIRDEGRIKVWGSMVRVLLQVYLRASEAKRKSVLDALRREALLDQLGTSIEETDS